MRDHKTQVWLFYLGESLVGFSSLGPNKWRLPDGRSETISYIPQVAVRREFHGQPSDAPLAERFSGQIMAHTLAVARDDGYHTVGLRVDAENLRAIRFYEKIGFVKSATVERLYGREFFRMLVNV